MAFEPGSRHQAWLDAVLETDADVPAPPRIGARDATGRTLLHYAAAGGSLGAMPIAVSVGYGVWGLDAGLRGYLSYYGDSRWAPTWNRGGVFLEARYLSFGGALLSLPGIEDGSIAHWQRLGVSLGVDVHLGGGDVEGWPLKSFMHIGTVATLYLWGGVGFESTIGLSL